jgi:hypothetical protein
MIAAAICLYSSASIAQPLKLTPPQLMAQQSTQNEADAKLPIPYFLKQRITNNN